MLFTCNRIEAHKQESGNTPSKKNLRHIQYGRLSALTGRVGRKNDRRVPIITAREMRTEKKNGRKCHRHDTWNREESKCALCAFCPPQLFMDKEKAEEMWLNRLISLRQERLMGSPVS